MKNLKPLFFYIPLLVIFLLLIFIISFVSTSTFFEYFSKFYLYFNVLFVTLFFYINRNNSMKSNIMLALFSLFITVLILEIIYPNTLINSMKLPKSTKVINNKSYQEINEIIENVPFSNIDKAEYYLDKGEFCTAWVYADKVVNGGSRVAEIKNKAENALKGSVQNVDNPKYIETLRYKNMVNQQRYLDAYYFSLEQLHGENYNQDFLIKLQNSREKLLHNFYSIDSVSSVLSMSGYSDIQFYFTKSSIKHYSIEKIVEYKGQFYIKNLSINGYLYPYIFIDSEGKVFSSGFKEGERFVYEFDKVNIPMIPSKLKLFSKEFYTLSNSSLLYNIKLFSIKNIKYFRENVLSDLILTRLTGYLTLLILFFMVNFFMRNRSYINYFFSYSFVLFSIKWFIKKIGLIIIYHGLSLSFIVVITLYLIWLIVILKKTNQQPFRS